MLSFQNEEYFPNIDESLPSSQSIVQQRSELCKTDGMMQDPELHKRLDRTLSQLEILTKALTKFKLYELHETNIIGQQQNNLTVQRRKIHRFGWLRVEKFPEFPDDLMRYILSYLNDSDRFKYRGLSLLFYESFYCQQVNESTTPFNDERAIRLAKRGRKFVMIEHLQTRYAGISRNDIQFISPYSFPRLQSFYSYKRLNKSEFTKLRHPGLVKLSLVLETPDLARLITKQRFPKLELLEVDFRRRVPPLEEMNPHINLKRLTIIKAEVGVNFFKSFSQDNFPRLEDIEIEGRLNVPGTEFLALQRQFSSIGIKLKHVPRRSLARV